MDLTSLSFPRLQLPPCCKYSFSLQSYGIGRTASTAAAMRRKIDGSLPQIKIWVFRRFFRALLALSFPLMPSCIARKLSTCKKSKDFTKGKRLRLITS